MAAERYDVAVVGGGHAGVAAAIAAAELGARTLLVEASAQLGGNAALAFVHTICGLYRSAEEGEALPAHPGFPSRYAAALQRAGAAGRPERAGRVYVLPTRPPRLARVARRLCEATPGLTLRTRTPALAVELARDSREPQRLGFADGRGAWAWTVVDATGDARAARLGGAEVEGVGARELQLPSFIFCMTGVDTGELQGFERLRVTHAVAGAARSGELPPGCESVLVRSAGEAGEVYLTLNLPRPEAFDPLDAEQVAALTRRARGFAERLADFLRRSRPAFARARIGDLPERIGIREGQRLVGLRTVSRDDVLEGREPRDWVARSTWPIELWQDHRRARFEHPQGACGIPLGALLSRSHPRLAAAGRCLSASHEAAGALRVIGTALATGEAAGLAAALAAQRGCGLEAVDAREVRRLVERAPQRLERA